MNFFLIIACLLASLLPFAHANYANDFTTFRNKYGKSYKSPADVINRMVNFVRNRVALEQLNEQLKKGKALFEVAVNQFSDLTYEEMLAMSTGYKPPVRDVNDRIPYAMAGFDDASAGMVMASATPAPIPAAVDWRTKNAVSPVKNQRNCGACWAFTANAALESHNYIKTKKMVILSEQNLIDCTNGNKKNNNMYLSLGCNGGVTSRAFNFIRDQPGVNTQSSYPYTATNSTCKFLLANVGATDKGFISIPADEAKIRDAVARVGPVAVAMHTSKAFYSYKSGIYNEANCPTAVNHAVLIVGYGTEKGVNFWIVKNSWGTGWGESGFFRIVRDTNKCGIAQYATYPVV